MPNDAKRVNAKRVTSQHLTMVNAKRNATSKRNAKRVTSQHLTIELPLGGAMLRFCCASDAPRTVSPPSPRLHIPSSQPPPPVRSISIHTLSAPNTAPYPDLDLHAVHERPPTSPSSL